jgi:hypothetical protein
MSNGLGFTIEALVAILLIVTIGYCIILNNRLKRLKSDEQALKATISELITATEMAERAVANLKATAVECEDTLGTRLKSAERCCSELGRHVSSGEKLLNRLARVVAAGKSLDAIPSKSFDTRHAAPSAPDPGAVADAARSFADRLRTRMGVQAA